MANATYNRGLAQLADYDWSVDAVNIGVLLVTNAYTFARTHDTLADVFANEASGTGYDRIVVGSVNRTTNEDDGGNAANLRITASSVVWTALDAGTDLRVVLFFITGIDEDDNTNDLLGFIDTGTNIPINTNGGDITLDFSSDGAVKFT